MEAPGLKTIFSEALGRTPGPERAAYLEEACRGDLALRAQVEALLQAHGQVGRFLGSEAAPPDTGTAAGLTGTEGGPGPAPPRPPTGPRTALK